MSKPKTQGKSRKQYIIFGIQGGKGSFNEEALINYVKKYNIKNYKIKYLYTSPRVLQKLDKDNIDYGLFAIQNSSGGMVDESIDAMAKYTFKIKEKFAIPIAHCLMKRKDAENGGIKTIMAHPQALFQCKKNLSKHFKNLNQEVGKGDMIDTAKIAWALAKGKLDDSISVLGSKVLAHIYDLEILKENLQDDFQNKTTFLLVSH